MDTNSHFSSKVSLDVLVSAIFSPREVTFLVSRAFQRGLLRSTWIHCVSCTCFCEVEISLPEAESSTSDFVFKIRLIRLGFCFNKLKIPVLYLNSQPTDSQSRILTTTSTEPTVWGDTEKLSVTFSHA